MRVYPTKGDGKTVARPLGVVDAYEVVTPDVDLSAIVSSVVQEFTGLDFSMTPTEKAL